MRDGDDAAAGSDAKRPKRQDERIRAAADAHAMPAADGGGKFLFEGPGLIAENVPAARQNAGDCRIDRRLLREI